MNPIYQPPQDRHVVIVEYEDEQLDENHYYEYDDENQEVIVDVDEEEFEEVKIDEPAAKRNKYSESKTFTDEKEFQEWIGKTDWSW
jgi:hypothetical protein